MKKKNTFSFRGENYKNFSKCCIKYGYISTTVQAWMRKNNITDKAEGLEAYINYKINKRFNFKGKEYKNFKDACRCYDYRYSAVQKWMKTHNITDKAEGLEAYINYKTKKKLNFKGKEYNSFYYACITYEYDTATVRKWMKNHNITDEAEGLESYINYETNKRFDFKGREYKSFRDACKSYGYLPSTVQNWMKTHNITDKAEGLEAYINYKTSKEFNFKGREYKSFKDACKSYGCLSSTVQNWMKTHNITDKAKGLEAYINYKTNKGFNFKGKEYKSFTDACKSYGYLPSTVQNWMKTHNITDKAEGLEAYINCKKAYINCKKVKDKKYSSFHDTCKKYGYNPETVLTWMRRNNIKDKAEGLGAYLINKKNKEFSFKGVVYENFNKACKEYGIRMTDVRQWMKNHNITDRTEGFNSYLEYHKEGKKTE